MTELGMHPSCNVSLIHSYTSDRRYLPCSTGVWAVEAQYAESQATTLNPLLTLVAHLKRGNLSLTFV
ncbi:MAG: hypothetical protein ACI8W7_000056 [Gammaproteobacteria bacterium]|jgi:hypothetical protein